ncbi:MAG: hypothetical protein ACT4R6_10590, partial [Gemmatimonadaceae bacterium]
VIDSTGVADVATFAVMETTHREFTNSVRSTLPHMRFRPAKIGPRRVRQLVQQLFSFKIVDSISVAKPAPTRKP